MRADSILPIETEVILVVIQVYKEDLSSTCVGENCPNQEKDSQGNDEDDVGGQQTLYLLNSDTIEFYRELTVLFSIP